MARKTTQGVITVVAIVVMLVAGFFMRSFRSGRELYAIGSNPDAAKSPTPSTKPPKVPGIEERGRQLARQAIDNLNKARLAKEAAAKQKQNEGRQRQ